MAVKKIATRLFIATPLAACGEIAPDKPQAHLLRAVLRLEKGRILTLSNGRDGEWLAEILYLDKKSGVLRLQQQTRLQDREQDVWLAFAPVKAARIDWLVEKATELGVTRFLPVLTQRTIVKRVNLERLKANAREAAEQSERLSVPSFEEPQSLARLMQRWPQDRRLLLAAERARSTPLPRVLDHVTGPLGLLLGPEGGFTQLEFETTTAAGPVRPVSLGPRILRSETAALAGLAVIQALTA